MTIREQIEKTFGKIIDKSKVKSSGKISSGSNLEFWNVQDVDRVSKQKLEYYYLRNPLVFAGINLNAHSYINRGFYIDPLDSREGKLCHEALDMPSFKPALLSAITQTLIYGDGYIEVIWNSAGKRINGYDIFDPKTMKVKWDKFGNITHYVQTVKGMPQKYPLDKVMFTRFWRLGDQIRGVGLVEPLRDILDIEMDMMLSIRDAVKRFSLPFFHVIKQGADDKEIRKMKEDFKDITRQNFFGTSERYELKIHGLYKKFPNLKPQFDLIINKVCSGLRIPKSILLEEGGAINRATLDALVDRNQFEIALVQETLSQIVEEQLFTPLCRKNGLDKIPDLKWYPPVTEDERQKSEVRHLDIDSILNTYNAELLTREEARKLTLEAFEGKLSNGRSKGVSDALRPGESREAETT